MSHVHNSSLMMNNFESASCVSIICMLCLTKIDSGLTKIDFGLTKIDEALLMLDNAGGFD